MSNFPNAALLYAAAQQIDDLDGQIEAISAAKKDIYDNVKETVSADDNKAFRAAVKLRQKRRNNRDKIEAHESLVSDMLFMLEGPSPQSIAKFASGAVSVAAIGIIDDATRAGGRGIGFGDVS